MYAMLPYNRSQAMSKCNRNNSDTIGWASCATFLFWPQFEVIFDLLLNRHRCPTAKSDRSVKIKNQTLVSKNNYGTLVFKMKPQTPVSKMWPYIWFYGQGCICKQKKPAIACLLSMLGHILMRVCFCFIQ